MNKSNLNEKMTYAIESLISNEDLPNEPIIAVALYKKQADMIVFLLVKQAARNKQLAKVSSTATKKDLELLADTYIKLADRFRLDTYETDDQLDAIGT